MLGVLLSGLAVSCSVKEDRIPCPNLLTLVVSKAAQQMAVIQENDLHVSVRGSSAFRTSSTIDPSEYASGFEVAAPRGMDDICACTGLRRIQMEGDRLLLPAGAEMDSLFAHSAAVDCSGETACDTVVLHKQFVTLTVVMKGELQQASLVVEASGNWCGQDMFTLAPVKGTFQTSFHRISSQVYKARIPRQGDDSLLLHIYESGDSEAKGERLGIFRAGREMARSGYDWTAPDLPDVNITIAYTESALYGSLAAWEESWAKEYNI